uniref:Uncharacterized protein n=1 Tax=Octopus bimaculoides TaxID=37653 RepID=A0A0L8FH19_OCTBM
MIKRHRKRVTERKKKRGIQLFSFIYTCIYMCTVSLKSYLRLLKRTAITQKLS